MNSNFDVKVLTKRGGVKIIRVWCPSAKVAETHMLKWHRKRHTFERVLSVTPAP
jgi:hypothetical protein